jgi:hypothetical protein
MSDSLQTMGEHGVHHAYLIEGGQQNRDEILSRIGKIFDNVTNLSVHTFVTCTVDDARALVSAGSVVGESNSPRIYVVFADSYTYEAQNSLLKILEEPSPHTYFFLVTPRLDRMLATVRSRCVSVVSSNKNVYENEIADPKKFLQSSPAVRMVVMTEFLKSQEDEEGERIKTELDGFVQSLSGTLYVMMNESTHDEETILQFKEAFNVLEQVRNYVRDRGGSTKMLAEYLAMRIPNFKV